MANTRLTMRKIREILRLRWEAGLSYEAIKVSTKVSVGACQKLVKKAETLGLRWPLADELDDSRLAQLLYPGADSGTGSRFHIPDWAVVHQELKRKGVTKQLLWEEYTHQFPNHCYSYSQFCDLYRRWHKQQKRSMRQFHKAGEKCFIDYCGPTLPIVCGRTGEIRQAAVFVAVLGASNYTYAEATWSQSLPDWLESHVRLFDFLGGTPRLLIPDNLKSGVNKACRYDPQLNPSYQQLAEHYRVAVMPARPYKPKDKAKVEVAVLIVERWIMARLRHHTFFSLAEVNRCIKALLGDLNHKPFKQLPGSRREAFEQLDKPALQPLPLQPYRYVEIKPVKVNIDYHVCFEQHHYSAPHPFVGETLELHASDTLISLYFRHQPVASHPRKRYAGMTTQVAHMPKRHQKHHTWTPGRLKNWAKDIGPEVLMWVSYQLQRKEHPEQVYRVCLGLLNLSRQYPAQRLDQACGLANREHLYRLKQVRAILQSNRDRLPEQSVTYVELPQDHENIRGPNSFH